MRIPAWRDVISLLYKVDFRAAVVVKDDCRHGRCGNENEADGGRRARVSIDSYDTLESIFLDKLILLPRY